MKFAHLVAPAVGLVVAYTPPVAAGLATTKEEALAEGTRLIEKAIEEAKSLFAEFDIDSDEIDGVLKENLAVDLDDHHSFIYADRHVKDVLSMPTDPDCMSREFNVKDENYDINQAIEVLAKCRLLILRNAFDPQVIQSFKPVYAKYLRALKHQDVSYKDKALFDDSIPSKRYEIFLPEDLNFRNISENEYVLNIVKDYRILDSDFFMHSFGTVVTEPGAPHQDWHQEDSYLFKSISFQDFGVAGHDLPPYTINLFTPLLNLTPDHGPTEFCVGTSITVGMQGEYELFDESITSEGDAFDQLMEFHREYEGDPKEPCPPQFLRSVLTNVGDVVLFDYQIIHRAGHNMSPDTRAQIYIAYSRKWFRDLNYHVNTHGDDEDTLERDISSFTRFAIVEDDEVIEHCETENCENEPPLETLRNILPQGDAFLGDSDILNFYISNIDLPQGLSITVDGKATAETPQPGTHVVMSAKIGSDLSIHDRNGTVLKTWKVPFELVQLVVSQEVTRKQCAHPEVCLAS